MWPFRKSPWASAQKQMKEIYPSDLTDIPYLRYLQRNTNCPDYIFILMKRVYINPKPSIVAALNKWFAIMRSSKHVLQVAPRKDRTE